MNPPRASGFTTEPAVRFISYNPFVFSKELWSCICLYYSMILLVTSAPKARDSLALLETATGERVQLAPTLRAAIRELRQQECSAAVIDEFLLETEPEEAEVALGALGSATAVFLNFAISGPDRLLRDVRVALRRRERERAMAHQEAEGLLRNELNEALTGILLLSQLALAVPSLPQAAEAKMRSVYQLAMSIRSRLAARN